MNTKQIAATIVALFLTTGAAEARHHQHHHHYRHHSTVSHKADAIFTQASSGCVSDNDGHTRCGGQAERTGGLPIEGARHYRIAQNWAEDEGVVPHPAGCPHTAFCGCGASVEIFGKPIRELYLAANWFKFPRTSPAPGMVAVRQHHVFVIRAVHGDGTVLAYDANSGGHKTRVHTVSLNGFSVRNPHVRMAGG